MRISDWSSDVCSSDLFPVARNHVAVEMRAVLERARLGLEIDMDDAEALGIAERPFEIVEQRPQHVAAHVHPPRDGLRSDEGRVGKECASTSRYRWWLHNTKKNMI